MKIKLLVLDIDGVLTDGKFIIDTQNNEYKSLNYRDLDAIKWVESMKLNMALLTGEDTAFVDVIANRLGINNIIKGEKDKGKALTQLSASSQIPLGNICYIGDSNRDAPALKLCGLGIVPQNATKKAKESALVVLKSKGGDGVVHEAIEYLFENGYL
ncbi:MAG: HAD hydrolase family protein [Proteobacteria bacterium]|nr:HAD hydrolase family protein [Pseudomonadota bacterium]